MQKLQALILLLLTAACAIALVLWNLFGPAPTPPERRPLIVTSITPLMLAAKAILSDEADYLVLLPDGQDPLSYKPDTATAAKLSKADMLVVVGNQVDGWALELARSSGHADLPVIRMSDVLVYGVPPAGVASDPHPGPDGKRSVDLLGRPFESRPSPYTAANTRSVEGADPIWLDPVYASHFIRELSVRLKEVTPRPLHKRMLDRSMLVGNNITSAGVDFSFRFRMLARNHVVGLDDTLRALCHRYNLIFTRVGAQPTPALYCTVPPAQPFTSPTGLPVFVCPGPSLDIDALKQQISPATAVIVNPMTRDGESGQPEYLALIKNTLDQIYESLRVAGGVK